MASQFTLLIACGLLGCVLSCGRPESGSVAPSADLVGAPVTQSGLAHDEYLSSQWELLIDATGQANLQIVPERAGQAVSQGRYYDLDISRFLRGDTLRVASIQRDVNHDLLLTFEHRHPFPAPKFSDPITAANRADLSYTGRLLILSDNTVVTFDQAGLHTDPTLVRNPDGFAATGDLLLRSGFTNNLFPYKLLVDEAADNRQRLSNGGVPQGNYDIAAAGWNQGNAGANGQGWTGFDMLHAGQSVRFELAIRADRLAAGPVTIPLAILIKYCDPRGTPDATGRFPLDPPDAVAFSYRMPHGALDVGRCQSCASLQLLNQPGSAASFTVHVRDWDALASETPDDTLWDNPAPHAILPGAGGVPTVVVEAPGVMAGQVPLTRQQGSGLPGDEYLFTGTITRDASPGGPQVTYALVTVTDPEPSATGYSGLHFGVDPTTLAASAARALPIRSYQVFPVEVLAYQGWVRASDPNASSGTALAVGPDGSIAIAYYSHTGTVDVDPGPCLDLQVPKANLDIIVARFDAIGNPGPVLQLAGSNADLVQDLQIDSAGRLTLVGASQSADLDFDPGPGTQVAYNGLHRAAFIARYLPEGSLDFVTFTGTGATAAPQSAGQKLLVDASSAMYIAGYFTGSDLDFDPTATADLRSSAGITTFLSKFSPAGEYQWTRTWNETGGSSPWSINAVSGDRLVIGGSMNGTLDLDPTSGTQLYTAASTSTDAWLVTLTSSGQFEWGAGFGGSGHDRVTGLAQHPVSQAIYAAGSFSTSVDFDPGPGNTTRASAGQTDGFVSLFSDSGTWEQVLTFGGGGADDVASGSLSATGTFLLGGSFNGTIDFDPGSGVDAKTAVGLYDAFIWRLGPDLSYLGASLVSGPGFSLITDAEWSPLGNRPTALYSLQSGVDIHPGPPVVLYSGGGAALIQYAPDGSW